MQTLKTVKANGHRYKTDGESRTRYQRHPYYPWLFVDTWGTVKTFGHVNPNHTMPSRVTKRGNAAKKLRAREVNLATRAERNRGNKRK